MVRAADTQGLSPADYLVGELPALPALVGPHRQRAHRRDLELTEALLRYAYHNRFGKVDPHELDPSWNYARNVSPGGPYAALERIIAAPDLAAQIDVEVGHGADVRRAAPRARALSRLRRRRRLAGSRRPGRR